MGNPANGGNGHDRVPLEILDLHFPPLAEPLPPAPPAAALASPLIFCCLTVLSTLAVGSEFAPSLRAGTRAVFGTKISSPTMLMPLEHPQLLLLGIPFSFTLLGFCWRTRWAITSRASFTESMRAIRISFPRRRCSARSARSSAFARRLPRGARSLMSASPGPLWDSLLRCRRWPTP